MGRQTTFALLALALAAAVISFAPPPPSRAAAKAPELPELLAIVGESQITRTEILQELGPLPDRLDHGQYEVVEKALERAVDRRLLEVEGAARGLSAAALLEVEVEAKLVHPTAEEVRAYWETNRAHLSSWQAEVVEQIRGYLTHQRRLRRQMELMAELRSRHEVRVLLGPFRTPVATEGHPSRGPDPAPVTLVTFSDFDCASCSRLAHTLERLASTHGDEVRLVFRQFPAGEHAGSRKAAEASLCAHDQGRFWPMHDALFAAEGELGMEQLLLRAAPLELEMDRFRRCLGSGQNAERVQEDLSAGREAGVVNPPVTFVNGRLLTGAPPYPRIAGVVEDELARADPTVF